MKKKYRIRQGSILAELIELTPGLLMFAMLLLASSVPFWIFGESLMYLE